MKLASALLLALTVASSGCTAKPLPVFSLPDCPAPQAPLLPALDAAEPLESAANMARLLERDDYLRGYIQALTDAIACYQKQNQKNKEQGS